MTAEERSETKVCLWRAQSALSALVLKLEADRHIATAHAGDAAGSLFPELIAYTLSRGGEPSVLEELLPFFEAGERTEDIRQAILKRCAAFKAEEEEEPGVFTLLRRFDAMAREYDGAFYSTMKVEDPGALSDRYIELAEAAFALFGVKGTSGLTGFQGVYFDGNEPTG